MKHLNKSRGMSLVGILISLLILAVLSIAASRIVQQSAKFVKEMSIANDKEEMRNALRLRLDCARTAANGYNGFYDAANRPIFPIVSNRKMKSGAWDLEILGYNAGSGTISLTVKTKGKSAEQLFRPVPLTCN